MIWGIGINFIGVTRMSENESTLIEYTNNNYIVCKSIGEQPYNFDRVITVSNVNCGFGDEVWLYPDRHFEPFNRRDLPNSEGISPGTLVLVGNNHGLTIADADRARELARSTGNSDSMRETKTLLGRTGTISFCHRCETRTEP